MKFKSLDEAVAYAEKHNYSVNGGYTIKPVDGGWILTKETKQ